MNVKVLDKRGSVITYGYAPEHYWDISEFYWGLLFAGEILSFEIIE